MFGLSARGEAISRYVAALALGLACGRPEASRALPPSAPPGARASASASAASVPSVDATEANWPALVRDEMWDAAWSALSALPDADKLRPEVRYVRARVAMARDDAGAVLPLLENLETALPLLAEPIGRCRALAKLAVGPFTEAGDWFAARPSPAAQLDAARAFEKSRDSKRVGIAVERLLASGKRTRPQEAEARSLRIRVADSPGDAERSDARWLATTGADVSPIDGLALVARLDPAHPLTGPELMLRARVLSEAGRTDEGLQAIDLVVLAPGVERVSALDRARARGNMLFRARGRSSEAARVLAECAAAGGSHTAEDAFHAARALSRADRDEEAIAGYREVQRRFPKSTWAEDAAFFAPYLRMLHADWAGCVSGFEAYFRGHSKGQHERDARRDDGLCMLLAGDVRGARATFERLSDEPGGDPLLAARMADLAALAAIRDGDQTHAIARWTDVARSHPLSWPALVARARLAEVGATGPPVIDSAPPTPAPLPLTVVVPAPADMLLGIGLDADAESELRDREAAVSAGAGSRASEALCIAYGKLGRARRRYQIAQTLPSALFVFAPDVHTRWAWDCAFPSPYEKQVRAAEAEEALPPGLLWAVMRQESGFDPEAVSPARAVGLMQILPETAHPIAEELSLADSEAGLTSPSHAIRIGARLLRKLLDRFHDDTPLAVAAYNAGADAIDRWLSHSQGMQLDAFVERIPFDETREYVVRVMTNLSHYAYLAQGEEGVPRIELGLKSK
jgi:peptidoglycan lytic transglycosylase